MKYFYLFIIALTLTQSAYAGEEEPMSMEEYMVACKEMLIKETKLTEKEATYACSNPYLRPNDNESAEEQEMREKLTKEADEAKKEAMSKYLDSSTESSITAAEAMKHWEDTPAEEEKE